MHHSMLDIQHFSWEGARPPSSLLQLINLIFEDTVVQYLSDYFNVFTFCTKIGNSA